MKASSQPIVRTAYSVLLILTVAAGVAPSSARAQFEDVPDIPPGVRNQPGRFEVSASYFDQMIFGSSSGGKKYQDRLDAMVSLQIDRYDAACDLSPKQKETLRLAAKGDVSRFEDEIETLREEFAVARFDQNKFGAFSQKLQPLRTKVQSGLFDENSLLHKVVRGILDEEQVAKFEKAELQRRKAAYRAKIGLFVLQLQNGIPMLDEQRKQFEKLLLEETKPPKAYGRYAYYVVMLKASQVPEKKMKAIFDDAQWRALKASLQQGRGMEHHLKQQGLLD